MPLIHILLTAASLSAVAGGAWGVERVMDRYARPPAPIAEIGLEAREEAEDEDPRLLY